MRDEEEVEEEEEEEEEEEAESLDATQPKTVHKWNSGFEHEMEGYFGNYLHFLLTQSHGFSTLFLFYYYFITYR